MSSDYFALMRRTGVHVLEAPRGPAGRDGSGVTVLVPTYTPEGGDRSARLRRCVDSVVAAARRAGDPPLALVVIDNGLSPAARSDLADLLRSTGRPSLVVEARPATAQRPGRYTAAAARNAGLAALAALPGHAPQRQRHLLFLDDDTAPAPNALAALRATLDAEPAAIAACPAVVPVADPGAWLAAVSKGTASEGTASKGTVSARRLAGAIRENRYDLLSVTSHGSLIVGRTVGLLVRQDPVLDWVRRHGPLFYEGTPFGSSEDMLAMAMLSRLGELWAVPAARVADEARDTPGSTRRQQFAWGYDHAWLVRALAESGALDGAVHALSWRRDGWHQHRLRWGARTGFLINPDELLLGYRILRAVHSDPAVADELFGTHAAEIRSGLPMLEDALRLWQRGAPSGGRARRDLPRLVRRDWSGLRDGLDAFIGHLAGNVAGSAANDGAGGFFLYGARQPASLEPVLDALAEVPAQAAAPAAVRTATTDWSSPCPIRSA